MTTHHDSDLSIEVPAHTFGLTYQAVRYASSDDTERPALCKTVAVEVFDGRGVQLVATDSYSILVGWVGVTPWTDPPELSESPDAQFVLGDPAKRGISLAKHMVADTKRAGGTPDYSPVTLTRRESKVEQFFTEHEWVLDYGDAESVTVPEIDVEFPRWRNILGPWRNITTRNVAASPVTLGVSANLARLLTAHIGWGLGGQRGLIRATVRTGIEGIHIHGGWMPATEEADAAAEDEAA